MLTVGDSLSESRVYWLGLCFYHLVVRRSFHGRCLPDVGGKKRSDSCGQGDYSRLDEEKTVNSSAKQFRGFRYRSFDSYIKVSKRDKQCDHPIATIRLIR